MMEALGAITGLIGAGLQAQNQAQANIINMLNLRFQKENAGKQFRLSTATRGDAYGNKQRYDDILNEWILNLTPTQNKITKAGEHEQLLSLTEDAKRNRDIRKQQRSRGIEAGKDYTKVLADYRYGQPRSELSIRDELTNLLAGVVNEKAGKSKTELMRAALREGRGGDMQSILKAVNDDAGKNMAQTMLEARGRAREEYSGRYNQYLQRTLPVMKQLQELMDLGGDMPLRFSDTPERLAALQQQQSTGIQTALQSGGTAIGNAYSTLATSMGKSPDLSSIAKSLAGGKNKSTAGGGSPYYSVMPPDAYYTGDRNTDSYGSF